MTLKYPPRAMLALIPVLLLAGCGADSDLVNVTGRVTLDGKPLEGAVVQFQPTAKSGSSSAGITNADGRYKLMHTFRSSGANPGEHLVTIRTANIFYEDEDCDCDKKDPIPGKYNSQSQLRRTVGSGTHTFDFNLKSR